jgi:hypothetical protein|tara:strand:+ start:210 stop:410 length:201 start_codon:yes stop_codon:yes gene_type:complete
MSEEQTTWTFKTEEIFEDIPNDPKNVMMKIPEEIAKKAGLVPGDKMRILWGDQGTIIIEKLKESNG